MGKLIQLELSRFSLKNHIIGILLANILILLLSISFSFIMSLEAAEGVSNFPVAVPPTTDLAVLLVRTILIVWEAVLISALVIEEYKNKTINLLYTYPVNRMKLILAKLILISMIIFMFYCLSSLIQYSGLFFASLKFNFITFHFENIVVQFLIIVSAIALGFIPMSIGMMKKSVIATIVSSLIIVAIVSNSQGISTGLISIPVVVMAFGSMGFIIAIMTTKKMIYADLNN